VAVKQNLLEPLIPDDLESNAVFAKITEAARRHRNLMIDMGEEAAKLKIRQEHCGPAALLKSSCFEQVCNIVNMHIHLTSHILSYSNS
jgi:hypothetical protein